jgi:hypothetical protein
VDPAPRLAQPVDVVIILRGLSAGDRHILPGRRRAAGLPCSAVPARRCGDLLGELSTGDRHILP